MDNTNIAWCNASWNPVRGCSRVSAGCEHCYAETMAHRFHGPGQPYEGLTVSGPKGPRWSGKIMLVPKMLDQPIRWQKPRRIFVNSMSDLFHPGVPDEYIDQVFAVMALAPRHIFQILTKRPERMRAYLNEIGRDTQAEIWREMSEQHGWISREDALGIACPPGTIYPTDPVWPLPNVHLGISAEDQETADERIPLLLDTPAAVRFVSAEPLLGPINFRTFKDNGHGFSLCHDTLSGFRATSSQSGIDGPALDWVIVGGESGPGARPCNVEWIRSVVDQCKAADVSCFVKQLGAIPLQRENTKEGPSAILEQGKIDREWPLGTFFGNPTGDVRWQGRVAKLKHRAGADPEEWPTDLRVQQFPSELS